MKKVLLIAAFAITFLFTGRFVAAAEGSVEDKKWHACANKAISKWSTNISMADKEKQLCQYIVSRPGPECEAMLWQLYSMGTYQSTISNFVYTQIVKPVCNKHPE